MELEVYREYLRRAEEAGSVRELHAILLEAQLAHRRDPDVDALERACWMHAERLIARGRRRHGGARHDDDPQSDDMSDWRARAAQL